MNEDKPDRLDRLLALAWERKLDKACPIDPVAFAQLPPLTAQEKADFTQHIITISQNTLIVIIILTLLC